MKYLKLFESFEFGIISDDVYDIFSPVCDLGFKVDFYEGRFLSPPKDIIDYPSDMEGGDIINGISIRIKDNTESMGMKIDSAFIQELEDSIFHFESRYNLKLNHLYFRTPSGIWFKGLNIVNDNMDLISQHTSKFTSYIDIIFKQR